MKMVLEANDIGDAVVEFLSKRGIKIERGQISLAAKHNDIAHCWEFNAVIRDVEVPPREGPYR